MKNLKPIHFVIGTPIVAVLGYAAVLHVVYPFLHYLMPTVFQYN